MLLAGKGHENYQILRDRTFEFDDREMARAILRRKGFSKKRRHRNSSRFGSESQHFRESWLESEAQPVGDEMRWTVVQVAEALGVPVPAGPRRPGRGGRRLD